MKIAFLDQPGMTYTANTPYEQPLGGTQSAACYLSAALARRGHTTTLISDGTHDREVLGVRCVGREAHRLRDVLNEHDVVIVLSVPIGSKLDQIDVGIPRVVWQHLAADFATVRPHFVEPERSAWQGHVYVSQHQRAAYIANGGRAGVVIGNGACPAFLTERPLEPSFVERGESPRMIFSSAPGRGLDFLLTAFPSLRRRFPGLTLTLCTGLSLYQVPRDEDRFSIYYDWAAALEGVEVRGPLAQPELAKVMRHADLWAFPSRVTESACIAMMEAGLSGCRLIACELGAIPETSGGHARLLPLVKHRLGWVERFVEGVSAEIDIIRRDPVSANRCREEARSWFRARCNWDSKAAEWEIFLQGLVVGHTSSDSSPSR